MIFTFLIKHFRTILDALIVVALIIILSVWDPFNWLDNTPKIHNTPVELKSVKEIGQLITAEYYGETIASLKESKIFEIPSDQLTNDAEELMVSIWDALFDLREQELKQEKGWLKKLFTNVKRSNISDHINKINPKITDNYLYPFLMYRIDSVLFSKVNKAKNNRILYQMYYKYTPSKTADLESYYNRFNQLNRVTKNFDTYYRNKIQQGLNTRKEVKNQIVYIGRGWVKAGMDFGSFGNNNFWYDKQTNNIYFKDFEPQILDCDINPWYIPEQKVPGFELVKATGKVKNDYEEAARVKHRCKEKLRQQAIQAGILKQSKDNARESIKNLFSLLMDTEIKDVIFTRNKYLHLLKELEMDSVVSIHEALWLDSILSRDYNKTDTNWYQTWQIQIQDLQDFNSKLKTSKFITSRDHYFFSAPVAANCLQDGIFDSTDIIRIHNQVRYLHTVKDSLQYYRKFITYYLNPEDLTGKFLKDSLMQEIMKNELKINFNWEEKLKHYSNQIRSQNRDSLLTKIASRLYKKGIQPAYLWFEDTNDINRDIGYLKDISKRYADTIYFKEH